MIDLLVFMCNRVSICRIHVQSRRAAPRRAARARTATTHLRTIPPAAAVLDMEAAVPPELKELPAIPHDHIEQLRERGFCVVKGLLSEDLLAEAVRLT